MGKAIYVNTIQQESASSFCKGLESKYFRFYRLTASVATTQFSHYGKKKEKEAEEEEEEKANSCRQYIISKQGRLCSKAA